MYPIPGHLALGLVGSRLSSTPLTPVLLGTFVPDVIDKILADVIPVAPYGRCWAHTLLSVAVISFLFWKFVNKEWGLGWAVGHILHLFGDIGFIPWLYPFLSYTWPPAPNVTYATAGALLETPGAIANTLRSYIASATETITTATGTIVVSSEEIGFWDRFTPAVKKVFIPDLIGIEFLMLIAAIWVWNVPEKKSRTMGAAVALFLFLYVFRITYSPT
ncbi:MAG: hypothetical protein HPY51_16045 [Candidatus Omnitrophica bacterium]|nr:hypothetical protein [Candidatus Omnitrophota bacterium]